MDKFLNFVAEIMEVEKSSINMDTQYNVFKEWDSMMMLTLIMELEAEYGVSIPLEKVGTIKTLNDLYLFVKDR